jgi:hypothetical protein
MGIMLEGMLTGEGDGIHLNSGLYKYLTVVVETIQCFGSLGKGINANSITPNKIAEVEKCCKASDHITRYMTCNSRQVDLLNPNKCKKHLNLDAMPLNHHLSTAGSRNPQEIDVNRKKQEQLQFCNFKHFRIPV